MKRVEVRWVDSVVLGRWVAPAEVEGARGGACVSVGFLVDENADAITIAQSVGAGEDAVDEYGQPIVIPRAALLDEPVVLHSGRIDWQEDVQC